MAYVIAAYGLVIVTLVVYARWVQGQRRQLERAVHSEPRVAPEA